MQLAPGRIVSKRIFAALLLLAALALAAGAARPGQRATPPPKTSAETYQLIEFYSPF